MVFLSQNIPVFFYCYYQLKVVVGVNHFPLKYTYLIINFSKNDIL